MGKDKDKKIFFKKGPTCAFVVTSLVHLAFKQLQTHYSIKSDHEKDEQSDVE